MNFSTSLLFIFTVLVAVATAFPSTVYAAYSTTITASPTTTAALSVPASSATQSVGCCHCELDTPAFNKTFSVPCIYKTANGTNTTVEYKGGVAGFKDNNHFVVALSISVTVAFVLVSF